MNTSIHSANTQNRLSVRAFRGLLVAGLLLVTAHRLPAPIQEVPENPSPVPHQSAKPRTKRTVVGEESASSAKTLDARGKFDGTWFGTFVKTDSAGNRAKEIITVVINTGHNAKKTIDITYTTQSNKPIYKSINELRVKWTYNSTSVVAKGSNLTIQWSPGQLSAWWPPDIPKNIAQNFGWGSTDMSNAGPAIYVEKGNELQRINDPNPIPLRRTN